MKFIWKGKFPGEDQLPKSELPPNAVPFKEASSAKELNKVALVYGLASVGVELLLVGLTCLLRYWFAELPSFRMGIWSLEAAIFLPLLTVLPHEFLHALCFGKDAVVDCYIHPKALQAMVVCAKPISKARFIFMSLLPNFVFGVLPLLAWMIFPSLGITWVIFSCVTVSFGMGDYYNVHNAIKQMPKGSLQQLSGFHSYWYFAE